MINLNNSITNVKNTPSITADLSSLVPDPATVPVGALYITTNTDEFLRNDGNSWKTLNKGGSGGTQNLESVLTEGQTAIDKYITIYQTGTDFESSIGCISGEQEILMYGLDKVNRIKSYEINLFNQTSGANVYILQDYAGTGNPRIAFTRDNDFSVLSQTFLYLATTNNINQINADSSTLQDITGQYATSIFQNRFQFLENSNIAGISLQNTGTSTLFTYSDDQTTPNGLQFQLWNFNYLIGNFGNGDFIQLNTNSGVKTFNTNWNNYDNGFSVCGDPNNILIKLGDYAGLNNVNQFIIDDLNSEIYTKIGGGNIGLKCDGNTYTLGLYDGTGSYLKIDAGNNRLEINDNMTTTSAGSNSTKHIKVYIAGTEYRIQLKNP